jgi:uncharacterized protein (DUF488 family)
VPKNGITRSVTPRSAGFVPGKAQPPIGTPRQRTQPSGLHLNGVEITPSLDGVTIFTIGHSTRALGDFVALLKESGIACVADVRAIRRSARYPHFNAEELGPALEEAGIVYRPIAALGGRRPRRKYGPSINTLWREEGFRNFADYAETPEFATGLAELRALSRERPTTIMCAEAVWWCCHRRLVADYLLVSGEEVRHILGPGKVEEARITEGAWVLPGGRLRYAAPDLFDRDGTKI